MQRLFFEKQIDLNHALQELISVSVNENLAYQDDPEGKRAVGTLEISGDYLRQAIREHFNDQIEIDVLAPFDRLEEDENFHLEVQDFDYHIQNGDLNLEIQVLVHGVGEKKERHILVDAPDEDEQAILQEIQNIVSKAELTATIEEELQDEAEPPVAETAIDENSFQQEENQERNPEVEEESSEMPLENQEGREESAEMQEETIVSAPLPKAEPNHEIKQEKEVSADESAHESEEDLPVESLPTAEGSIQDIEIRPESILETGTDESLDADWKESESIDVEDLFDDEVMAYVTYPIYVVQPGDSYERIAQYYQVDAETLMDYNQHISLKPHQLLVIPPR